MNHRLNIIGLRVLHAMATVYFLWCLLYLFYAAVFNKLTWILVLAVVSLAAEGVAIFMFNGGDCPLIHVQRRIGDDRPFFSLFLPETLARQAIPMFARITWLAVGFILIRLIVDWT